MWKCPHCGEGVENNFDLCWNCGTTKDGSEQVDVSVDGEREVTPSRLDAVSSSTSTEVPLTLVPILHPFFRTILVAAILPLIYLFIAAQTIIGCSLYSTYLQWYSAAVITFPVSAVAELSYPRYQPGLVGYLFFAVLNAMAIFVACYIGIHVWNAYEVKWNAYEIKPFEDDTTSTSHRTHPLTIPVILGVIPGFFAGSMAFSMTMGFMGPAGAIPSFAVTAVFVTGIVGAFVSWISRRT